jgi:hypothetical protein
MQTLNTRWTVAALVCAAACSGSDGRTSRFVTIDTLPNGAVVVHNEGGGMWDSASTWRLVEDLRIGTAGEGHASFSQIPALEVDTNGRIYIVDRQTQEVRVFDSTGAFVRTIGRPGKGPGEFVGANGLAWDPHGRLWVVDQQGERYTLFDTTGRVVETHLRRLGFYGWRWEGAIDTAGLLMEGAFGSRAGGQTSQILLRFGRAFARRDTFPLPWTPMAMFRIAYARGYSVAPVPFTPRLAWVVDSRAHVWFGFGDAYRIIKRRVTGDTVRIIERAVEPIHVTTAEVDSAVAALVDNVSRSAPRADVAAQVDRSRIPPTKPLFNMFVLDDVGRLWVQPSVGAGQPTNVFDVFDSDGRYLGRVAAPFQVSPYQPIVLRRGSLYGVAEDADGVQYVVRAKIFMGAR